jgi:putative sigma-54 modulation protein
MSINFTAKNVKLTGAQKAFAEKNLQSIEKISGEIIDAEIIVNEEKLDFKVEMTVRTKLHSYHVEDKDPILKQALRSALNTLKAQAKKNKEKLKLEKKRGNKEKQGIISRLVGKETPEEETKEPVKKATPANITVSQNFSKKPITMDEAIFFLKESDENAYMFANAETNKMSVIFYDNEKNISIIEEN